MSPLKLFVQTPNFIVYKYVSMSAFFYTIMCIKFQQKNRCKYRKCPLPTQYLVYRPGSGQ